MPSFQLKLTINLLLILVELTSEIIIFLMTTTSRGPNVHSA